MRSEPLAKHACSVASLWLVVTLLCACASEHDEPGRDDAGLTPDASARDASHQDDAALRDDSSVDADAATGAADGGVGSDADAQSALDAALPLDAAADASDLDAAALPALEDLPYARVVTSFTPGDYAGFGQTKYPDVVFGPPKGQGTGSGSLDVLSLGVGGSIVLELDYDIVDGEGADFVVFENPFWPSGSAASVFAEPGQVSVSEDGSTWHSFACDADGDGHGVYAGCAGWTPTLKYDAQLVVPLDPDLTGGDAFDLEDLGLSRARFVRIVDQSTMGTGNNAGFDLDAVGVVHYDARN